MRQRNWTLSTGRDATALVEQEASFACLLLGIANVRARSLWFAGGDAAHMIRVCRDIHGYTTFVCSRWIHWAALRPAPDCFCLA